MKKLYQHCWLTTMTLLCIRMNYWLSTSTVPMNPPHHKKPKLYPWQNGFLTSFPWLRYNITSKTASCSLKKCEMYVYPILQHHITNTELGKQGLKVGYSINMKRQRVIN